MYRNSIIILLLFFLFGCNSRGESQENHTYTNQLAGESSPYLLQHAHNPVDWHPWNDDALAKAREEDNMLIISVGYSSCHWCHVMEEESFSDTTVAALMNDNFLSIKVDREERPDIDEVYMTACQLASDRSCGWPLNVVAMPDGRPVWAGTYFPKKAWVDVLNYFIQLRKNEPQKLEEYAERLSEGVGEQSMPGPPLEDSEAPDYTPLNTMAEGLLQTTDYELGGRLGNPKFPMPDIWSFLLQYHFLENNDQALEAVTATLDGMAMGGIYDVLGGGFSRYATDEEWKIPHFEKMLYDNAQLVSLYSNAYQLTGKKEYLEVVEHSLDFVSRELTDEEGGFYASLDADSESEEGKFYVWTQEEIASVLQNEQELALITELYDISQEGNWEDGKNILRRVMTTEELASGEGLPIEEVEKTVSDAEQKLFAQRENRVRPRRDDKRLCSWNALMLTGYLDAYLATGKDEYLQTALANAAFIESSLQKSDGRLLRSFPEGKSSVNGFLEDYVLTANAFQQLYQSTFDEDWLHKASVLIDYATSHFFNEEESLYYATSDLDERLVARQMPVQDNVIPSGNAAIAGVLNDLGHLLYNSDYLDRSKAMLQRMSGDLAADRDGAYLSRWGQVLLGQKYPPFEVAIVGEDFEAKRKELSLNYLPRSLFLGGANEGSLSLLENKLQDGMTMIYVCQARVCKQPVQDAAGALEQMKLWR